MVTPKAAMPTLIRLFIFLLAIAGLVFGGMVRNITRAAERDADA